MGLSDMVLIKDNHLKLIKNLTSAIAEFRKKCKNIKIEVECENLVEVNSALAAKAAIIMLDNITAIVAGELIDIIRKKFHTRL
jgi:nicotinate-nucleotide pyrophosphorylase (carboxylating)